ncbi:MAG TPA: cyclic nucleotide-binding domain-containing protein, partial [Rhizobiales bacterium]|nr:cyclic nucleotide-binding domain-containing protein [Hyphomicrobiales bacterium]
LRDSLSGLVFALVIITYCISFSALIFQGSLSGGLTLGLSALLTGTVMTCLVVALTTTLTPAGAGPDTPVIAVMSVLAAAIATQVAAANMGDELAVIHVMLAISVATLFTGLLLFALGALRMGVWLRFIPYPVIGGFLAASGWLLVTGGIEVMTGVALGFSAESFTALFGADRLPQFLLGASFALGVFILRRTIDSFLTLPIAFFVLVVVVNLVLLGFGFSEALGGRSAWYLDGLTEVQFWMPVQAVFEYDIDWGALILSSAEIGVVCGVTAISVLLDVASLEVARQQSADLDKELRYNGVANILSGFAGGAAGNLSLSGSILIQEAGAVSRFSGVAASGFVALVLFFGADVASYVPTPLLGGLLAYLGLVVLNEALIRSPAQRSRMETLLAGAIMAVIIYSGYLLGVVLGIVGACLLFALSYSRIGIVRRHLTRLNFASNVERSPHETALLKEHGEQIHVLWLSGFIFFGSSNRLFEFIKSVMDAQENPKVRFLVLDFGAVPGLDTSAVLSLIKLKNYCDERAAHIAFAGLNEQLRNTFRTAGIISDDGPHRAFSDRNEALEWCENLLLSEHESADATEETFERWLKSVFGGELEPSRLMSYFDRRAYKEGQVVLKQGGRSNSVDILATGSVAITITDEQGHKTRLRRMAAQTVIGEMGFFRKAPRAAAVIAEQPSIVFRLTRKNFERMQDEDPKAAAAFFRLIVRVLSDRLEFANREISALV